MSETQNYKNHTRFHPLFHFVGFPILAISLIYFIVRIFQDFSWDRLMFVLLIIGIVATFFLSRTNALKAQDRVIRLEERLRYNILLSKDLAAKAESLKTGQMIALRFASDAELPALVAAQFPTSGRSGICGHSMGGHGALTLALRHPGLFRSVSALAPICTPMQCPWGVKALGGYLGADRSSWAAHDATELVMAGASAPQLLIDQGKADKFLTEQLHPHLFEAACAAASQPLTLRRHAGYDHGYYFIASVIEDHLRHHAAALNG